ncbi:MAG: TonB-dependent receptor plug domain-containing protein [Novosphingobium sp.]
MIAVAAPSAALAQDEGSAASNAPEEIIVIGIRSDALDRKSEAGSRLGLSLRETPQTIDTLSSATILGRGLHTLEDATRALPGVLAGFPPGDMGNFSVRGFTGNQVSLLFNGFYYGPANFIARPGSSFTIDRIEAVKGPASILYGNGAVGGAINVVTKEAVAGRNEIMALGSYGSFDTYDLGLDVAHQFDTLALRAIVSQNGSNGYVHDSHSHAFNAHVSALWQAAPSFEVAMSIDYLRDRPSGYYGTPLVPEAVARDPLNVLERGNGLSVDGAMRKINYNNLTDATIRSRQWMPQAKLRWTPAENIQVQNEIYYIDAHRVWKNSEVYNYNSVTGLIDRDRFAIDQYEQLWGDRATARFKHKLGRMQNTFLVGFEYSHLDFKQYRGFPNGDSVNPWSGVGLSLRPSRLKPQEL